jgi:polygalacturonase
MNAKTTFRLCIFLGVLASWRSISVFGQATLPTDFKPTLPVIPSAVFALRDYGAIGDGKTMNNAAIQKAIDACAKAGGGRVEVPKGTFLTGPFSLASNLDFHLDDGATILMTDNPADFKLARGRLENCISADNCHDLSITGNGTIDGHGASFWKSFRDSQTRPLDQQPPHRPMLIVLMHCQRVLVQGVTLTNSPMFHLIPQGCRDVTIDSIHILAPQHSPNTDGIDPSGINFLIEHCTIDNGDDDIALKPGARIDPSLASCENFLVTDCTFLHGHGMSIGSGSAGGVENLLVRDCTFNGTDAGIRMKSMRERGGLAEHLTYENLKMTNVKVAILITDYYPRIPEHPESEPPREVSKFTPIWRNISIRHVTAEGGDTAARMIGLPEMPIQDITFTDVHVTAKKPMQLINASGIHFVNSSIVASNGAPAIVLNAKIEEQK